MNVREFSALFNFTLLKKSSYKKEYTHLPPFSILRDRLGGFHQEKIVFWLHAVNHTIYGASTKLLLSVLHFSLCF